MAPHAPPARRHRRPSPEWLPHQLEHLQHKQQWQAQL